MELLSCHFIPSPEDVIRRHITYRYSALKHRNYLLQQRLQASASPSFPLRSAPLRGCATAV